MLFHEIYGCYYNTVAKILTEAVEGKLSDKSMRDIIQDNAFAESFLTIIPALREEKWQLLQKDLTTPLKHKPSRPLTTLELRWLKAISLDPRIKLFPVRFQGLEEVKPLFTPEDYVIFDKYNDGDPFEDENYIAVFRTLLQGIHEQRWLHIEYLSRRDNLLKVNCVPLSLEYSEKDDKFRLHTAGCRYSDTINVARILSCELGNEYKGRGLCSEVVEKRYFVLELLNERNALERVLLHFAHFQKQAERISDKSYKVTIYYDSSDETELLIRVLSFGPLVKVIEPESFIRLIKERLRMQRKALSSSKGNSLPVVLK